MQKPRILFLFALIFSTISALYGGGGALVWTFRKGAATKTINDAIGLLGYSKHSKKYEGPGGKTDKTDPSKAYTCAREFNEETAFFFAWITDPTKPTWVAFYDKIYHKNKTRRLAAQHKANKRVAALFKNSPYIEFKGYRLYLAKINYKKFPSISSASVYGNQQKLLAKFGKKRMKSCHREMTKFRWVQLGTHQKDAKGKRTIKQAFGSKQRIKIRGRLHGLLRTGNKKIKQAIAKNKTTFSAQQKYPPKKTATKTKQTTKPKSSTKSKKNNQTKEEHKKGKNYHQAKKRDLEKK